MTDNEKQAIQTFEFFLDDITKNGGCIIDIDYQHKEEYQAMWKILNLIENQQAEIKKYKEMYAVSVADRVNNAFKQKYKNDEDLEMLYKGCQIEIEKKDKIIDLMAEWFEEWAEFIDEENYYTIFRKMSKEDIKEYFKKKVEVKDE